ncbi:hypothetical protein EDD29_2878 [Actinocorallia herbida]|uniref:Uncharacterized protein n=1 Tax=Actinocorallia herbida TaxID=58109 RepID=A0A3N1CVR4_9ACTN|nr:hypothetical protein [Actinocorallia herbida]ROO85335.1 hypothetical protein EDD29_2878 [Actinocorallia herbida]
MRTTNGPRAWRLPDGDVLIEGPAFDLPPHFHGPGTGDTPGLTETRTYYRLRDGDLVGVHEPIPWAEGWECGIVTYRVTGDALTRHSMTVETGPPEHRAEVALPGLAVLPPAETPTAAQVHALARRHWREAEARGQRVEHGYWPRDAYRTDS